MQKEKKFKTHRGVLQPVLSVLITLCIVCIGCSPNKRLNRLIKRHPELIQIDTTIVHDTLHTETIKADTVFKDTTYFRLLRDTITVTNDRLTIKQYYHRDSIFIEGECLGDTIIREIPVPYETVKPVTETKTPNYVWLIVGGLIILCILAVVKR